MANTAQAKKRARQAEAHRERNAAQRSMLRTHMKNVAKVVEGKDKDAAQQAYRQAASSIDKMTARGHIHKNAAARYKSQLNNRVRKLAS